MTFRTLVSDDIYIGQQSPIECINCGKQAAYADIETMRHPDLPVDIPVGRCFACDFMWSGSAAEDVVEAYVNGRRSHETSE